MTNTQIAKITELPVPTISRIFSGETASPGIDIVVSIAKALDISIDELYEIKKEKQCTLDELENFVEEKYSEELKFLKEQLKHQQLEKKKIFGLVMFLVMILVFFLLADIALLNRGWIQQ